MPTWQVTEGTDDCRYHTNLGVVVFSLTSQFMVGCASSTNAMNALSSAARFLNVTIPAGSEVTLATLIVTDYYSGSQLGVNSRLRAERNISPLTFSDATDFLARTWTTEYVNWDDIPLWVLDTEYTSPDFHLSIQEVIGLSGWASGNPIVVLWDDFELRSTQNTGRYRQSYSYNDSTSKAPKLYVEYTTVGTTATPPTVSVEIANQTGNLLRTQTASTSLLNMNLLTGSIDKGQVAQSLNLGLTQRVSYLNRINSAPTLKLGTTMKSSNLQFTLVTQSILLLVEGFAPELISGMFPISVTGRYGVEISASWEAILTVSGRYGSG